MRHIIVCLALLIGMAASHAADDPAVGVWQTQAGDTGGYLHVQIEPCDGRLCGLILRAYDKDGIESGDYEHLGKTMISAMKIIGNGRYAKGSIWAPDKNKTYKSKMQLSGNTLKVKGCIAFICRSQSWSRVN